MSNKGKKDKPMLNAKQERFCLEYVIDSNATQAAIRAGYSEKTANSKAHQLLTIVSIKNRVAELQKETAKELKVDRETIITRLNNRALMVERLHQLSLKEKLTPEEESQFARLTMTIRTSDGNKADEILNKMLGFNEPDKSEIEHKGITGIDVNIIRNKKSED